MQLASREVPGDSFAALRGKLSVLANAAGEHCGLPVPIDGERLIVEPSHPASALYASMGGGNGERVCYTKDIDEGVQKVNYWYSADRRCDIVIWRSGEGTSWGYVPGVHHAWQEVSTMGCSVAWSVDSECNALEMLRSLIPAHLFKMYFLSGMFVETSKRSGVTYVFRKLRPTIAMRPDKDGDGMKILCCLCLHPIGYYQNTWAGSMCPTDDVIAHLMLMRGDEPMFWKRANQIPAIRPEAGL
jgi:hypothetical protein